MMPFGSLLARESGCDCTAILIWSITIPSGMRCVQAVKATAYTEKGNVSLGKAITASGSASNLLIWFIIFFAAALLFFDWFHS